MSAKGGQKEGFPGQRPKSRAKEGHDRAPSQKQGSLAAMPVTFMNSLFVTANLTKILTKIEKLFFAQNCLKRIIGQILEIKN